MQIRRDLIFCTFIYAIFFGDQPDVSVGILCYTIHISYFIVQRDTVDIVSFEIQFQQSSAESSYPKHIVGLVKMNVGNSVFEDGGIVRIMLGQIYNVEWRLEVVVRFKSYG